jgi:hypothetical protein
VIIYINGWPGVGKLTVGRIIAGRLSARLVHNHLILNPAFAITEHGSPAFIELTRRIRRLLLEFIEQMPEGEHFVLTDALEEGSALSDEIFAGVQRLAERRRVPLLSVSLDCDADENARRLTAAGRTEMGKLTAVEVLMGFRKTFTLLRPEVPHHLDLDTTDMTPEDAAEAIIGAAAGLLGVD